MNVWNNWNGLQYSIANHVQIDVDQTAMQVLVGLDGGGMITVFPERAMPVLSLVVLLRGAPCDELHTLSNYVWARVEVTT